MRTIQTLTQSGLTAISQQSKPRSAITPEDRLKNIPPEVVQSILRLWDRMIGVEGRGWTKRMGDANSEAFVTFCEFCKDLTPEDIKNGFGKWMDSDDEFLNAKKFRKLCKPDRSVHDNNWQAYKCFEPSTSLLEDKGARERSEQARQRVIGDIKRKLI